MVKYAQLWVKKKTYNCLKQPMPFMDPGQFELYKKKSSEIMRDGISSNDYI